jgi:2,4-dienoyl-CoA reductase (NADPH2)
LKEKGVTIVTDAQVTEIFPHGAKYISHGQEFSIEGVDAIVLAMGTVSDISLREELKDLGIQMFLIGDAKTPRNAMEAIAEGAEVGRAI